MQPQKEIYFSVGEQEWINKLQEMFGVNYFDAVQYVVEYKREQAFMYKQKGHNKMFCQIMDELGELTPEMEQAAAPASDKHYQQIIVPGEESKQEEHSEQSPRIITND